ncbi:hypothetical protein PTKIN_Ptkin06aG0092000 [Pterospermum kingtungense]
MMVGPRICINDGNLVVHGKKILSRVADNIVLTPGPGVGLVAGTFIGATASDTKSLHVFSIGVLEGLRFMCCFRFKLWWMTQRMGTCGKDVPLETQFMLTESKEEDDLNDITIYTVFLPLLEGQFHAVLQGNDKNEIEICLEGGDNVVETNRGLYLVYMHSRTNPFEVINQAVKAVEKHMQTFLHREKKKSIRGGTPPRFFIIDDGWQQIENKPKDTDYVIQEGAQFATRLTGIKENAKFQKNSQNNEQISGLKHVVDEAKQHHNVKYVYVWHALAGYWGGVKPVTADIVMDSLAVHGLGLVHPKKVFNFYNELHAYLASCGVDGVKVNIQNIIETLGAGHGGRDPASHTIHISSMAYSGLFLGKFMQPDWDMFHSLHPTAEYHAAAHAIGGCAIYVSDKPGNHNFELLKKLVLPDGSVLRALLPGRPTLDCLFVDRARDGISLLKIWNVNKCYGVVGVFNCQGAGWCKITKKTCIHDASPGTLTGSVCAKDVDSITQVAGPYWKGETVVYAHRSGDVLRLPKGASVPVTLKVLEYELFHFCPVKEITTSISFAPIGLLEMFNSSGAVEQFEVQMTSDEKPELYDGEVSSELTTSLSDNRSSTATITLKVRGCGRFGAYCSQRPLKCSVGNAETDFNYDLDTGLVTLALPVPLEEMYRWPIEIQV